MERALIFLMSVVFSSKVQIKAEYCANCINPANALLGNAATLKLLVFDKFKDSKDQANALCDLAITFGHLSNSQKQQCIDQSVLFLQNPKFKEALNQKVGGKPITGKVICEEANLCPRFWNTYDKYTTSLGETSWDQWKFLVARNKDIYAIRRYPGNTEVHVLLAESKYAALPVKFTTALHRTNIWWDFAIAPNNDIFCICKTGCGHTKSKMTELHILSVEQNYTEFTTRLATGLYQTGGKPINKNYEYQVSANGDLFVFKKVGVSKTTEVLVLTAVSGYQQFSLNATTALHVTGNAFQLFIHPKTDDLVVIKKMYTGTNSTEIHVLSRLNNYQTFLSQTGSVFHETNYINFTFAGVTENWDIYGFDMVTGQKTELYVLHSEIK